MPRRRVKQYAAVHFGDAPNPNSVDAVQARRIARARSRKETRQLEL
ncbi:hypothetical protein [Terriglobus sp.]